MKSPMRHEAVETCLLDQKKSSVSILQMFVIKTFFFLTKEKKNSGI